MERFTEGQRVKITESASDPELVGVAGTVMTLRSKDTGAWVELDKPPSWRKGEKPPYRLLLFPEECEPE